MVPLKSAAYTADTHNVDGVLFFECLRCKAVWECYQAPSPWDAALMDATTYLSRVL
jgi:hypothetical protein